MNNVTYNDVRTTLGSLELDIGNLEQIYPELTKPLISLSSTGISRRNYAHWKKEGLVISTGNERSWVKLNLFEYIWLRIIQTLRDYGTPIPMIKTVQTMLYIDVFSVLKTLESTELEKIIRKISGEDVVKYKAMINVLKWTADIENLLSEIDKVFRTLLSSLVSSILLQQEDISLIIRAGQMPAVYAPNSKSYGDETLLAGSHLRIPLRTIIDEFFSNPDTEKFAEAFGLINKYESRVLDALRKNEYKEILIQVQPQGTDILIKAAADGNFRQKKITELMTIFGRNMYSEVVVKLKNGKTVTLKNKLELYSSKS